MATQVQVSLEYAARDDEVAAVAAVFAEAGVDANVRVDPMLKGAGGDFPWMVIISVPATAFLTTFAAEAGKDAYKELKKLIKRLYDARKTAQFRTGYLTFGGDKTSTSFNLPPELPDEAWQQLPEITSTELRSGVLRWDREMGQWRG